jgi:hypothetical protein
MLDHILFPSSHKALMKKQIRLFADSAVQRTSGLSLSWAMPLRHVDTHYQRKLTCLCVWLSYKMYCCSVAVLCWRFLPASSLQTSGHTDSDTSPVLEYFINIAYIVVLANLFDLVSTKNVPRRSKTKSSVGMRGQSQRENNSAELPARLKTNE